MGVKESTFSEDNKPLLIYYKSHLWDLFFYAVVAVGSGQ